MTLAGHALKNPYSYHKRDSTWYYLGNESVHFPNSVIAGWRLRIASYLETPHVFREWVKSFPSNHVIGHAFDVHRDPVQRYIINRLWYSEGRNLPIDYTRLRKRLSVGAHCIELFLHPIQEGVYNFDGCHNLTLMCSGRYGSRPGLKSVPAWVTALVKAFDDYYRDSDQYRAWANGEWQGQYCLHDLDWPLTPPLVLQLLDSVVEPERISHYGPWGPSTPEQRETVRRNRQQVITKQEIL